MKSHPHGLSLLALCFCIVTGAQGARAAPYPPVTVPSSEIRTLQSTSTGRSYDLYIRKPADFDRSPDKRYPVLYLLDGQWDFKLLDSVVGGLVYDKWMPDIVVVGITYSGEHADYDALRAMDYTPTPGDAKGSGDGPKFLAFLKTQLIPFVETQYRGDPARRILGGHSRGGLFALYTLFSDSSLFWGYLVGSPAITWDGGFLVKQEQEFARTHKSLPARLYLAVGDAEDLATPDTAFVSTLRQRHYVDLHWDARVIEGERHSGVKPEFYNRGLRFLFSSP